jgi:hypothetical protein
MRWGIMVIIFNICGFIGIIIFTLSERKMIYLIDYGLNINKCFLLLVEDFLWFIF